MTKEEIKAIQVKARRANARLRALENSPEGFSDISNAYTLVKDVFRRKRYKTINKDVQMVLGGDSSTDKLRFRTDISTMNKMSENAVKVLEQELDIFLSSTDSTPQQIRKTHREKQQAYERSVSEWMQKENIGSREKAVQFLERVADINAESHTAAFENFNENRKRRGVKTITREQYDFLFTNAYTDYLSKRFSSSDEWVDTAIESITENTHADLVIDYLNKIPANEEPILTDLISFAERGISRNRFERKPEGFLL